MTVFVCAMTGIQKKKYFDYAQTLSHEGIQRMYKNNLLRNVFQRIFRSSSLLQKKLDESSKVYRNIYGV